MSFKKSHSQQSQVTKSLDLVEPHSEPGSFAHLVELGWRSESANLGNFDSQHETDCLENSANLFQDFQVNAGDHESDALTGSQDLGFGLVSAEPSEIGRQDGDAYCSDGSWLPAGDFDDMVSDSAIICDISACVDAAYAMLPHDPPKPIWEQGVFADIFGDGVFMKSSWTALAPKRRPLVSMPVMADASGTRVVKKRVVSQSIDPSVTYADIVVHKTDQTWQEEREAVLQSALKRWLVVLSYFNAKTVIRVQLDCELTELGKLNLLADIFRGRAPATLLKRVRAIEKVCHWFGLGNFSTCRA